MTTQPTRPGHPLNPHGLTLVAITTPTGARYTAALDTDADRDAFIDVEELRAALHVWDSERPDRAAAMSARIADKIVASRALVARGTI